MKLNLNLILYQNGNLRTLLNIITLNKSFNCTHKEKYYVHGKTSFWTSSLILEIFNQRDLTTIFCYDYQKECVSWNIVNN